MRRFGNMRRPSIAARLSAELERALLAFAGDTAYALVHVSRLYLASLGRVRGCKRAAVAALPRSRLRRGRRERVSSLCPALPKVGPRPASRLGRGRGRCVQDACRRNGCHASISCSPLRRAKRDCCGTRGNGVAASVVPNVAPGNADRSAPRAREGRRRDILFVGNMSYLPNIDAAMWFASRVWPRLRCAMPFPLRFVIAGAGAPREVTALARQSRHRRRGQLRRRRAALPARCTCRCPDQGGRRHAHQALESANYGVPIVATRFGAAGTGFRSGHELLLADNERDFANVLRQTAD